MTEFIGRVGDFSTMGDAGSESSKPSWKRGPRTAPRQEKPGHDWNRRRERPKKRLRGPGPRAVKAITAAVGFLTFLTLAVWLLFFVWQRPEPVAVVLVGASYADNLAVPHNALGWKGLQAIHAVLKAKQPWSLLTSPSLQLVEGPRSLEFRQEWDDLITELVRKKIGPKTVLIVVSLHGVSDSGGAYLLPNRAAGPRDRIPLTDLIESLAKLPPEKHKVLVLEGSQVPADWRLGMLSNEFARHLKGLEKTSIPKVKNLWVLSGCDVDQRCWGSEGLGRTAFSHYLIEALRGVVAAQGRQPTLAEVYQSIRRGVSTWAWNSRGAIQEPVLLGPGGGEENRPDDLVRRAGLVPLAISRNVPPPAPGPAPDRAGLSVAWTHFHDLDRLSPHPSVYSPRRWREYRARLVRYEELTRAGAVELAEGSRARLQGLETQLRGERFLNAIEGSAENTLVMAAVAGKTVDPSPAVPAEFAALARAASRPEADKEWQKLRAADPGASDDTAGRSLRARVDDFLIQSAAKDPARVLQSSALQLDVTRGMDYPQPAEVHFLRMLSVFLKKEKDRPLTSPYWSAVGLALKVRREAEPAALGLPDRAGEFPYCEHVAPWIKATVEAGDQARRLGEDRLFSSEPNAWAQSHESFAAARDAYRKSTERARVVRAAFAVRDRVLSDLPDYSRWLADRRSDELEVDLPDRVEKLWDAAHKLAEWLETPGGDEPATPARALDEGFVGLRARFLQFKTELSDDRLGKDDWMAARGAAAVAFPDADDLSLRKILWDRLDNVAAADFEAYHKPVAADPSNDAREVARRRHYTRSRVQGRMALAVIGRRWFDDPAFTDPAAGNFGNFDKFTERVKQTLSDDEDEVAEWRKDLARAGEAIGLRWQRLAAVIGDLAGPRVEIPDDLSKIDTNLVKADRLGRLIDGGAPEQSKSEPTELLRRVRVHDVLLWMAGRTWNDHWYAEDPLGQQAYYFTAGSRFVRDAALLFPRSTAVKASQALLARKGRLAWEDPPGRLVLTSELGLPLAFRAVNPGDVPEGLPVVKPLPRGPIRLGEDGTGYRIAPMDAKGATVRFSVSRPLPAGAEFDPKVTRPGVERAELDLAGYFRGQPFTATSRVDVHPLPEVIAVGPAPPEPPGASLAVRADQAVINHYGVGTGSIAIVLDCSGSMVPFEADGLEMVNRQEGSRFALAKRALVKVLTQVPKGTNVSLWVFGQTGEGLVNLNQLRFAPGAGLAVERPELTIRRLLSPTPWGVGELPKLKERLDTLWPYYGTPLVEAMVRAKADLDRAKGLKTLLVLTDGNDSRFNQNASFNQGMKIPEFLKKSFGDSRVSIFMIFFQTDKAEFETARANFNVIKAFNPPGEIIDVEKFDRLVTALEQSLSQKLVCEILRGGKPVGDQPLDVTTPRQEDQWWPRGLDPGQYTLRVKADRAYTKEVELARGDRLLVRLVDAEDGGIGFERALYSDDVRGAAGENSAGSRVSVLAARCEDDRGRGFRLLAGLESLDVRAARLSQPRPRFAWFELAAKDTLGEPEFATRWRERAFFPAPCCQFDVPSWPAEPAGQGLARPVLKAWWGAADDLTPAALDLSRFGTPEEVAGHEVALPDAKGVKVESVLFEEHTVERRPGEEPQSEPCLVVRLDYDKAGGPVVVDPQSLRRVGIEVEGHEHRVYTRARKYAGMFWPVTRDRFEAMKKKPFDLVSVARFRAGAEKQGHTVELKTLPPPQVGGPFPRPPDAVLPNN